MTAQDVHRHEGKNEMFIGAKPRKYQKQPSALYPSSRYIPHVKKKTIYSHPVQKEYISFTIIFFGGEKKSTTRPTLRWMSCNCEMFLPKGTQQDRIRGMGTKRTPATRAPPAGGSGSSLAPAAKVGVPPANMEDPGHDASPRVALFLLSHLPRHWLSTTDSWLHFPGYLSLIAGYHPGQS